MQPQSLDDLPTDEELNQTLLTLLNNAKFSLYSIHGDLLDAWYEDKESGPLALIVFAKMLEDDFGKDIDERYPGIISFVLLLDNSGPETASYYILLSHKQFTAIALYGHEMSPEEFATQLELAQETL